jgi:hypothetical protein
MMAMLAALTAFTMIRTRDARSTMVTP